jgi:heptosyltransferase-3
MTGPDPTERILVVSLSNVGDAVMTTPVLEALHQRYPAAVIDIVGDRRSSNLFEFCPYRGHIFHQDKRGGIGGLLCLIRDLRQTRYELIVDLRTDGLAYLLSARRRLTKWGARSPRGPHAIERLYATVSPLFGTEPIPATRLWLDDGLRAVAAQMLQPLPAGPRLALGPGAKWARKTWPPARFIEMVEAVGDLFAGVVILGGPGDTDSALRVATGIRLPCVNLAGRTSLLEDCAVLSGCAAFVGNDSGAGHMAAALETATLTVFGPTDPLCFHPWGPRAAWVTAPGGELAALTGGAVAERLREQFFRPGGALG